MSASGLPPPISGRTATDAPSPPVAEVPDGHALMAQMGSEVAAALSGALERVTTLATTGKIGRKGLRELRESIELARRVSIMGQQVTRFASGRVKQSAERVDLTGAAREALLQHRREVEARGIEVRQSLGPAKVMADPTILFTLLQALVEWCLQHARSAVDFRIDLTPWPVQAKLGCSFRFLTEAQIEQGPVQLGTSTLDTMPWRLVQQAAVLLGATVARDEAGGTARAVIEFARVVNDPSEIAAPRDREPAERQAVNSKPLAGSHLLVIAARREIRAQVRDALRHMGMMVDFVPSVEEAREFCRGGMPHAILHESALSGERFERLRKELLTEVPTLVFIELTEQGKGFEVRKLGDRQFSCVSSDSIMQALPSALMFELSRMR